MRDYKITIVDIIKGLLSLALILIAMYLSFAFFLDSTNWFGKTIKTTIGQLHPIAIIILVALFLALAAILGGFLKAMEAGFSPHILFKRFVKDENNGEAD